MSVPFTPVLHQLGDFAPAASPDRESFAEIIAPMLAGAQARGVADTLELLGIGAALIDATGRVLYLGGRGRRISGGRLRMVEDHLVADEPDDNRSLQVLIGAAIDGSLDTEAKVRLGQGRGRDGLEIKALRFPSANGSQQLLRAILIFEELAAA